MSLPRITASIAGLALAAGALALADNAEAAVASPEQLPVVTAGAFVDSVGVNVHTYYNDTSYADTDRVLSLLQGLGVRHVRDGLVANRPDEVAALRKLGVAGIRSLLIVGGTKNAATQSVDPAQLSALSAVRPYVDAVEPSNEYDCSGDPAWAAHQRDYAATLTRQLQARDEFRSLGVLGSSFCRPESVAQFGAVTGQASVSNAHDYANGQLPELALAARLPEWAKAQDEALPMVATETGYHNATNAAFPSVGVSEQVAADYTVRTLLEASRLGVARTYLYELLDEKPETALRDPEQHFGLVRQDGTVKPAYTAVRNLLGDLTPTGSGENAGENTTSDVTSVRGGGSLLRSLSITAPDGGETLALWQAVPVGSTETARPVRVQVAGIHTATTRQPSRGNTTTALGTGTAFTVPVDGSVTLLHLAPSATTAAASSCTAQPAYPTLASQLGAVASDTLTTGWTGSPAAATTLPDGVPAGARVTADGQQKRVAVPGRPSAWTIALWQRTGAGTANFSTFARAVGASGGLLRTYDVEGDAPSHMQLSGYGLPVGRAGYGTETWGQALGDEWHLVSLSVGAGKASLAVDGIVAGTVASGAGALTGVDVGSLSGAFRGSLAGLTVYGRALSADELGRLATTSPGSCEAAASDGATTTTVTKVRPTLRHLARKAVLKYNVKRKPRR